MDSKLHLDTFERVLQSAIEGCQKTYDILQNVVRERTQNLLNARGIFRS